LPLTKENGRWKGTTETNPKEEPQSKLMAMRGGGRVQFLWRKTGQRERQRLEKKSAAYGGEVKKKMERACFYRYRRSTEDLENGTRKVQGGSYFHYIKKKKNKA